MTFLDIRQKVVGRSYMGLSEYDQWKEANQQLNQIDQNARQNRQQAENVHEVIPQSAAFYCLTDAS
ncbi:hypothetical protein DY000_02049324 [Brassica cretica]|uniref:Uncharacterized protein n=1 Tax=Brassica cretica TaxID=69181 RepID=A0ABQ7F3H1_BRACR|nr:hypothetical protein DY000_02049324 [Brassica cretica]